MNLQAYANHRKALGLRGTSHVAVINAYNDGRLSEPAVRREGRSWIINAELADEQWAARTDPSEYGGQVGGGSRPIGIKTPVQQQPATTPPPPPPPPKGGPSLAVSKQVKAAYEAKLTELEYKERSGEMGNLQDVRKEAARLARQVRDLLLIVPSRNAAKVAVMSDPEEIRALLQQEIESALRGLASA
jgi:hypothetical protein